MGARQFELVDHGEHRPPLRAPAVKNVRELFSGVQIKSGKLLIEQKNNCAFGERPREKNALLLSTRKHPNLAIGERLNIEFLERALNLLAIFVTKTLIP